MTLMPWSSALSVGMPDIDEQHHWLVDTLNQLHDQLATPQPDRALVGQVLEGLMDYTMNHFVMEEAMFQRHDYPQAAAHKALHDQFTAQVLHVLTEFEDGKDLGGEVVALVNDWLVKHIMGTDKAYVPFITTAQQAAGG